MNEKISALLDDELSKRDRDRTVKMIGSDAELSRLWHRYNIIGAVCRREIATLNPGLVHRVAQLVGQDQSDDSKTRPSKPKEWPWRFAWAPVTAIAVSVVALVAGGVFVLKPNETKFNGAQTTASVPVAANATRWENAIPEHEAQLNALLVEHGEFTPMTGLNGLISYAKFVSYDAKQ